ncbi:transposase [Rhodococcus sp. 06-462-5]|uniref:transposase n=1 Tax=unclassified Rhodococcus (in: high G+C Gram-positive bacteria) TaxID=192944 RepID=UPI000B9A5FC1|nr:MULTISPECIES: transposase [unclassified Rhodococcus (in: high G+C Gram-positive bacteria)]OZC67253.1 transposase [Rhodococcus sp. 06-462-5]OZE65171.1 transposase [Rhodococcus sp. 02-925g]
MLKRGIVREVFRLLTITVEVPDISGLRPALQARHITLARAPRHFQVWPATISQLEFGRRCNDDLANNYRKWLLTA